MAWNKATTEATVEKTGYGKEYYINQFKNNRAQSVPVRMALVAKENCGKTGFAVSLCRQVKPKGKIFVVDVDNSAAATLEAAYPDDEEIIVLPLLDERDESIYNEDATVNYANLIDKMNFYVNIIADVSKEEDVAGIVFDGVQPSSSGVSLP